MLTRSLGTQRWGGDRLPRGQPASVQGCRHRLGRVACSLTKEAEWGHRCPHPSLPLLLLLLSVLGLPPLLPSLAYFFSSSALLCLPLLISLLCLHVSGQLLTQILSHVTSSTCPAAQDSGRRLKHPAPQRLESRAPGWVAPGRRAGCVFGRWACPRGQAASCPSCL